MKKKRRNKNPAAPQQAHGYIEEQVDMEIDLHGYAIDEAMLEIELQMKALKKSGYSRLRVIHGGSAGEASIHKQMRRNMERAWSKLIEKHYYEPHNNGATIIVIR